MFIATQMPLPTTVGDLWRMMNDYNSFTIVMLNPFDNTDKVGGTAKVSCYGPVIHNALCQPVL